MRGKLIIIEGTDSSGKRTQAEKLIERLKKDDIKIESLSFPMYDTPTGKIIGGPYLGKSDMGESWFKEGAPNVDPMVASLYYAADRRYNRDKITKLLDQGINVILDRYTPSNMGHQASKIRNREERLKMYKWIEELEYGLLKLPVPDIVTLLYMPYEYSNVLRNKRYGKTDSHEISASYLRNAETTYLELADLYHYKIINCISNNEIRAIEDINNELYDIIKKEING